MITLIMLLPLVLFFYEILFCAEFFVYTSLLCFFVFLFCFFLVVIVLLTSFLLTAYMCYIYYVRVCVCARAWECEYMCVTADDWPSILSIWVLQPIFRLWMWHNCMRVAENPRVYVYVRAYIVSLIYSRLTIIQCRQNLCYWVYWKFVSRS